MHHVLLTPQTKKRFRTGPPYRSIVGEQHNRPRSGKRVPTCIAAIALIGMLTAVWVFRHIGVQAPRRMPFLTLELPPLYTYSQNFTKDARRGDIIILVSVVGGVKQYSFSQP